MDVEQLAGMVSVGTLLAFTMVAISLLILRYVPPDEVPLPSSLQAAIDSVSLRYSNIVGTEETDVEVNNGQTGVSGEKTKFLPQKGDISAEYPLLAKVAAQALFNEEKRRKIAGWTIMLTCVGALILTYSASNLGIPRRIRFEALQSEVGKSPLRRSGRASDDISSVVLVEKNRSYIKSEIIGLLSGILALVIICGYFIARRCRKLRARAPEDGMKRDLPKKSQFLKVPLKEIHSATNNLDQSNCIGEGTTEDILILEATDSIGGRIKKQEFGSVWWSLVRVDRGCGRERVEPGLGACGSTWSSDVFLGL